LSLQNVGGIFVVLLAGMGIACVTAAIEYAWTKKARHREHRLRLWGDGSPRSGNSTSQEEILRNGFDKLEPGHGVTHLDLAAHGTVSLSRCSTLNPLSGGSLHSLPTAAFHTSCAVPQSSNGNLIIQPTHPESGWVKPNQGCMGYCQTLGNSQSSGGGGGDYNRHYHHQEQCPHYNNM